MADRDEDDELRLAAIRNSEAIFEARVRYERELRDAKESLEKNNRELAEQREWFRVTLSSIGDAVITTDARALITFMNPIAEAMTGWTSAQASGQPLTNLFKIMEERTRRPLEPPVMAVLREGRRITLDDHTLLIGRDGAMTAIEDSAAPIRDSSGNITGAVMVFHDVTARRKAELARNESELRFRSIFSQAAVGIAVTDGQGQFLQVNQKFADTFGYSPAELERRSLLTLIHPLDQPSAAEALAPLFAGHTAHVRLEKRCLRNSGEEFWMLGNLSTITGTDGSPQGLIGVMEDITSRKRAEEAQARLAAVITSSDDSIISMTLDGEVLSWNRGAELMYGYSAAEMIGRSTSILIPPDRANDEPLILRRLRAGERIEHFETLRRRKDGVLLNVSIAVSPIEDSNGRIIGASKITRDITESKRIEAELRETDRRKDEFLATLSHELRNPLAPIRQAALILGASESSEEQRLWSHNVIRRQVQHMSLLLDDLLDVSRITRGTLELRLQMVELREVIDAAIETARPAIDSKGHELRVTVAERSARVLVDPLRLAQVLSNLLTNAAKYTDPGGVITLRSELTEKIINMVVSDSGIGIPTDSLHKVFDMFSQVKSAQDRSEGGLGIGLALARGLVHLHGGSIEAFSTGNAQGSEFIVQIPRRAVEDEAAGESPKRFVPPPRRRLLIADDNRDAADSLAILFEIDGHEVRAVYDGTAAAAALADFTPHVALLDIGMPGLDGYEVARLVRSRGYSDIILIALTGWGQERDKSLAMDAGFNYHFTKPVEPERINEILRRASGE